jgi:hypothetical protein
MTTRSSASRARPSCTPGPRSSGTSCGGTTRRSASGWTCAGFAYGTASLGPCMRAGSLRASGRTKSTRRGTTCLRTNLCCTTRSGPASSDSSNVIADTRSAGPPVLVHLALQGHRLPGHGPCLARHALHDAPERLSREEAPHGRRRVGRGRHGRARRLRTTDRAHRARGRAGAPRPVPVPRLEVGRPREQGQPAPVLSPYGCEADGASR